jgi:hypothetical protein
MWLVGLLLRQLALHERVQLTFAAAFSLARWRAGRGDVGHHARGLVPAPRLAVMDAAPLDPNLTDET